MQTKTILELFPGAFPGHKLNRENSMEGYAPWKDVFLEKGEFFNKVGYKMKHGWRLAGWATPPYLGGSKTAAVFEKVGPTDLEGNYHERREPGYYWIHCPTSYNMIVDDLTPEPVKPKRKVKAKLKPKKRKKKNVTRSRSNKL